MKMTKIALAAALAMGAASANAAGLYAEVGVASVDFNSTTTPAIPATSAVNSNTASSIGVGYRFNELFGLEFGHSNAGSGDVTTTYTAAVGARSAGDVVRANTDVSAFYFGGNLTFALTDKIDLIARAGISDWEAEYSSVTLNGAAATVPSISGTDPYYGLSMMYKFDDQVSLGLGWQRQEANSSASGYDTEREIDTITATLRYNFK